MKMLKKSVIVLIVIVLITISVACFTSSCSKSSTKASSNKTDQIFEDWDVQLKGYNVVKPPATLTLSIMRVNQPNAGANVKYKYQYNENQPWIDVSTQVNAVGYGEYCDIPLNFTTPGKYWITTKIFDINDNWTGLYNTDFVIVLKPTV